MSILLISFIFARLKQYPTPQKHLKAHIQPTKAHIQPTKAHIQAITLPNHLHLTVHRSSIVFERGRLGNLMFQYATAFLYWTKDQP